jgi:CMP-N,N'-diacetyllegionaminic acid synthase
MIDGSSVIAIIPARGGSKGLPGKNILEMNGTPLIGYPIAAANRSVYIDRVLVTTDSQAIADKAIALGGNAPFIRPAELSTDTASTISVIEHALEFEARNGRQYSYVVLLEPTSPMTEAADVDAALELLASNRHAADSIVSVALAGACHPAFMVTLQDGMVAGSRADIRRQEVDEVYFRDGSLYISDARVLMHARTFCHDRTLGYVVPKYKAFEVDDLTDFIAIEALMKNVCRIKLRG